MVVLISTLFMIFYIAGFFTALAFIKFAKNTMIKNEIVENKENKEQTKTNNITPDIISEWLYGEPKQNGGDSE